MKRCLLFILALLLNVPGYCSNPKLDSLIEVLHNTRSDTEITNVYDRMFSAAIGPLPDSAMQYAIRMTALSEKIKFEKGIGNGYNHMAQYYFMKENRAMALQYLLRSLSSYEKARDTLRTAKCYNNIGVLYYRLDQLDQAMKYYKKALEMNLVKKDSVGCAQAYSNIGIVLLNQGKYSDALATLKHSLSIKLLQHNPAIISSDYTNMGNCYYYLNNYDSALFYNERSFAIRKQLKDTSGMGTSCNNIAGILRKIGKLDKALVIQLEGIPYCKRTNNLEALKNSYEVMSEIYEDMKDPAKALAYFKLQASVKDSLLNESTNKSIAEMQTRFDSEKKEKENELLQKENVLKDTQIEKEQTVKKYLYAFVGLILVLGFVLYNAYNNKRRSNVLLTTQKDQITQQKKEIIDSIHYARRIQQSLLPPQKYIERNMKRLKKKD